MQYFNILKNCMYIQIIQNNKDANFPKRLMTIDHFD